MAVPEAVVVEEGGEVGEDEILHQSTRLPELSLIAFIQQLDNISWNHMSVSVPYDCVVKLSVETNFLIFTRFIMHVFKTTI